MGALTDKVAVVIGACGGIGRAVSLLFAREGAALLLNDTGGAADGSLADPGRLEAVSREVEATGARVHTVSASAASAAGAAAVVDGAVGRFGRVDVLVYAAGILADAPLARLTEDAWARLLATELTGPVFAVKAAAASMQRQGGGRIVLTTGQAGLLGNFGQPAYSAAAAGVYGLMRAASIELQRHRVFVNAVAPLAKTRLTEHLPLFEHVETMTAFHVAPAYLFLASELSSDVTGTVLSVAGGRISQYRVVESSGRFKETDGGVWTAAEIQEAFASLAVKTRA